MFKKIILLLVLAMPLLSCPFDEADTAVTIDAHKAISKEMKNGDFTKVKIEIEKQKELYEYFGKPLYASLLKSADEKDGAKIKELLDQSLVLEIKELLEKVEKDFDSYKKSRLFLVKAKKHLKVLTKDKKTHKLMKGLLKSLGNPGVMGMGEKASDKEGFLRGKGELLEGLRN